MLTTDERARVVVVLVATRNSLNIGAAARAMSNFGFETLRLVRPWEPSFEEAREAAEPAAVGAKGVLQEAKVYAAVAEAVADCTLVIGTTAVTADGRRDLVHPLDRLDESAKRVSEHLATPESRVAILFGSEKTGLTNDDLTHCHRLLRIPTRREHISMNLGQAVGICMYELGAHGEAPEDATASAGEAPAASGEVERLTEMLIEVLQRSGYITPGAEDATEAKLRRTLRRMPLSRHDAHLALGMARQVLWRLRPRAEG